MEICILTRYHSFVDARIFEKEAKSFAKMGHQVTIVAGRREGKLFKISKEPVVDQPFQNDEFVHEGIRFVTFAARYVKVQERVKVYSRMVSNLKKRSQVYFQDALVKMALEQKADIYIAHELESLYDAIQIKRILQKQRKKVKVIFDAHELEFNRPLFKLLMREVDYLFTVSDGLRAIYRKRYPRVPIAVIYNSPLFVEEQPEKKYDAASMVVAHEGFMSHTRGRPDKLAMVANYCAPTIDAKFKIIGGPANSPEYEAATNHLKSHRQIQWVGWVDYKSLPEHYRDVHVGYIDLPLVRLNRVHALPNKFFSYLNNGIPVVVNAARDMKRIITAHKCGIVIAKANPTARDYAKQLETIHKDRALLRRMSENARRAMQSTYSWQNMEKRLEKIMASLQ